MDGFHILCAIAALLSYFGFTRADHEQMVGKVEPITVPLDFATKLQCVMNIEPDKFQWKFYPLPGREAYNPKAFIDLSRANFQFIPAHNYTTSKKESDLTIQADTPEIAGDYQCLAYYGASVVASVPWRITIATLRDFPHQNDISRTVTVGNTINWRCELPESNPTPYIDYYKNGVIFDEKTLSVKSQSLILPKVSTNATGRYKCRVTNPSLGGSKDSFATLNLKVVQNAPLERPSFVIEPKRNYTVTKGDTVFLECSAVGNPTPKVIWSKKIGEIPKKRADMVDGGLIIKNVAKTDDGVYVCKHENSQGFIERHITLVYNEPPSINCLLDSTEVKQGERLELDCEVSGTPEPQVSWFLNGFSVTNDSAIEAIMNRIYFTKVEKRHAGSLQIFARNIVKTVYSSISIKVIPISTNIDISVTPTRPHHKHRQHGTRKRPNSKNSKLTPPSKPTVTRLNDEAVVVRWTVPRNEGLPIMFFKVQYKELGPANQHDHHNRGKGAKWKTTNADIPPHIRSYEVNNLKSDYWYNFRIAAVYSNSDNRNSVNSDKFLLRKLDFDNRNPLPVPLITQTEAINSTAVKIYWKCDPSQNISLDGYFVNYNSASSAGDYLKATVDGRSTSSFILSHLQPDTVYDIKLQSFNSKLASEFSSIMKAKTLAEITTASPSFKETTMQPSSAESAGISKLYIIIAAGVIVGGGAIVSAIALLLFCRKWKQKKNMNRNDRDKPAVDDHHIQADSNDYVVGSKSPSRPNGCVPPNRITITANPLADADNKNQNMIEMSCLSSQNNNCAVQPASASSEDATGSGSSSNRDRKNKNREKRIRKKHSNSADSSNSGENYV